MRSTVRISEVLTSLTIWTICLVYTADAKCPPLPYLNLPNGTISPSSPNSFRLECHKDYYLAGPSVIRCYQGNWTTDKVPKCIHAENRCDPVPRIDNADVFGIENTLVGSTVQYMCHSGYRLLGDSRRTCLERGSWSGFTPACINKTESLQSVAERLGKEFLDKLQPYSTNDSSQQARYLDQDSLLHGLELIILIDRSSSIDPHDLDIGKRFIYYLLQQFDIQNGENPNGARGAVIAFGTNVDVLFNLDDTQIDSPMTAADVLDERLQPNGGGTAMVPALTEVVLKIEPFFRPDAKRALFLISDGEPNVGSDDITPKEMASQLKDYAKIEIFAVGIGPDINSSTLESVASDPVSNHVFQLNKFSELEDIMDIIKNRPTEAPPLNPEKCGYLANNAKTWPWIGATYTSQETDNGTRLNLCAAVLICSQWVLTSASCFYKTHGNETIRLQEAFVVLGENHLVKVDPSQMNFYAKSAIVHPDYNPKEKLRNNIALIELNEPAPLEKFRTVCLPPTDRTIPMHAKINQNASVAGWGNSSPKDGDETISVGKLKFQLGIKTVTLAEEKECNRIIGKPNPDNSIFCAEFRKSKDSCIGIPGSPVIAQDSDTGLYHVLGILSLSRDCVHSYSQYIELRKFIPWINRHTNNCHFIHYN